MVIIKGRHNLIIEINDEVAFIKQPGKYSLYLWRLTVGIWDTRQWPDIHKKSRKIGPYRLLYKIWSV